MCSISSDIEKEITEGLFYPVFQPICLDNQNNVFGLEVLTRWENDRPVGQAILSLEEQGLSDLFLSVLVSKLTLMVSELPDYIRFITVNVSSINLINELFLSSIFPLLNECRRRYIFLSIEITESNRYPDVIRTKFILMQNIIKCRSLGIKILLDDFGNGYHNDESIINMIRPDILKLDRSLCKNTFSVHAMNDMLKNIFFWKNTYHFEIVAEGIETVSEFNFMKSLGVKYFQGYLFGKPDKLDNLFWTY